MQQCFLLSALKVSILIWKLNLFHQGVKHSVKFHENIFKHPERCTQYIPPNAHNNVAVQGFGHWGFSFTLADLKLDVSCYISKLMHLFSVHRGSLVSRAWPWSPAAGRCCWWWEGGFVCPFRGVQVGRVCLGEILLHILVQIHPFNAGGTTECKISGFPLLSESVSALMDGREVPTKAAFPSSLSQLNLT